MGRTRVRLTARHAEGEKTRLFKRWMKLSIRKSTAKSALIKYQRYKGEEVKQRYFEEWIKLSLEIQAMRCWRKERLMKKGVKGMLMNIEEARREKALAERAKRADAFSIKKRAMNEWKGNLRHVQRERWIARTYIACRNEKKMRKCVVGWRIWLHEEYKRFEQKKLSNSAYEFKLLQKGWKGWRLKLKKEEK